MLCLLLALIASTTSTSSASVSTATVTQGTRTPLDLGELPFDLTAASLVAEPGRGLLTATGTAVLRRGSMLLYADRMTFDRATGRGVAEGSVRLLEGVAVLKADRAEIAIPGLAAEIRGASLLVKRGISHEELAKLPMGAMATAGQNDTTIYADRLVRTGTRRFEIDGGSFTPCDCGPDSTPSWRIDVSSASVDLDSGAWLHWPVFYIKRVPVLVLPAFYFPLGDRRSGLLAPRWAYTKVTGWQLTEPLYVVLGRSFDATLEATWWLSRGPAPTAELRWAPAEGSEGQVRFTFLSDRGVFVPDMEGDFSYEPDRAEAVNRWALAARHTTAIEAIQGGVAAEINLTGDPAYLSEFADAYLARQIEEAVSRVTVTSVSDRGLRVAAGLAFHEDLRPGRYALGGRELREISVFSAEVPESADMIALEDGPAGIRQRLIELRMDAPPHGLLSGTGPLFGEARLSAQWFIAPNPLVPRFARADLRPSVFAPIDLFGAAVLEPSVAIRMTGWSGESDSRSRFGLVLKSGLSTEISRAFGSVVHRVRPELLHLLVPFVEGGPGPLFETRDELDQLARVHQVAARLATDLHRTDSGARILGLELVLGRDLGMPFGAASPGAATSELAIRADAGFGVGIFSSRIDGVAVLDVDTREFVEATVSGSIDLGGVVAMSVTGGSFASAVPRWSFVAPEELIPSRTIDRSVYVAPSAITRMNHREVLPWTGFEGIAGSLTLRPFAPLLLQGETLITFGDDEPLKNLRGTIGWTSPCACWGVTAWVGKSVDRDIEFGGGLNLARLGEVRSP